VDGSKSITAKFTLPELLPDVKRISEGILLTWDNETEGSFPKYSMTLMDGDRQLYHGGHGGEYAEVNYSNFELNGTEVLRGRFMESQPDTGEFVRNYAWFEIDLSKYADALANEGTDLGNGWREADWFGIYFPTGSDWVYHSEHGWIYPVGRTLDSIWYWDGDLGWCWTNKDVYPYVYREKSGWLYYERGSKKPRLFYEYATEQWITLE
jgi:hypothetical protein